ncbi:aspartate ammonia-lyase [Desulfoluna spongiiphila]|uniref:Aspartate ammonia-lyase n=1 Tax=Desulfoluna spongiiphila TaxID=419481 RepID=A0A1G5GDE7_9BACT|nr:aspartate ammonia-lyase [Desulfoluna spongiiphila]SCY49616.1 aspartate ammonia-lyase [Desulfoluna spongiiphila]
MTDAMDATCPDTRIETDSLGEVAVPASAYWGAHTRRALDHFPSSGQRIPAPFVRALALVKRACAETNVSLKYLDASVGEAICAACDELAQGDLGLQIVVDPFQGGAGTSTNMNVNEVIAGRAAELLGSHRGDRGLVSPLDHVNLHQSTNDVYPTALKVAALFLLKELETETGHLQQAFQIKETAFASVVKLGRTQMMDAVPMTLGMEFGAFGEAIARDRWRVFKCRERLKQVNLGGTAVGTGLGAPRAYIFKVVERLKAQTGVVIARSENLVDATQNLDSFVEVSGILKAYATNLVKIASDLRLLSSGPHGGLGEINLPPRQAGSSIMAGKVNPVIPEAVIQVGLRTMANDQMIGAAASMGQLDLNHLMPLVAHGLLESLTLLNGAVKSFRVYCVDGITPNAEACKAHVEASDTLLTALVPFIGYDRVAGLVEKARATGRSVADLVVEEGVLSTEQVAAVLSPKRMQKLGFDAADEALFKGEKP